MAERNVPCPRCGEMVRVPTTGQKVRCTRCNQKIRFDPEVSKCRDVAASEPPPLAQPADEDGAEPPPLPSPTLPSNGPPAPPDLPKPRLDGPDAKVGDASEGGERRVPCPRCGETVWVPVTGEKVRCPQCSQKLRFEPEVPAGKEVADAGPPPLALPAEEDEPESQPPALPSLPPLPTPRLTVPSEPVAALAERPPTEGSDGEPSDARPEPDALEVEELRELWPALCRLIAEIYEGGRAADADRLVFRTDADRAAVLAERLLPTSGSQQRHGREVITAVLSQTSLDDIVSLSLEQFRSLQHSLDEAQALLDRALPEPKPEPPAPARPAGQPMPLAAQQPPQRVRRGFPVGPALFACLLIAAGLAALIPGVRRWIRAQPILASLLGTGRPAAPGDELLPGTDTAIEAVGRPKGSTATAPAARLPKPSTEGKPATVVRPPRPPKPRTAAPARRPSTAVPPAPKPLTPRPAAKPFLSRWKPGPDGWITLFDGKSLDGWLGADGHWTIKDGELRGVGSDGVAFLSARGAEWQDYRLATKLLLGAHGTAVISHGTLAVQFDDSSARLGYPADAWKLLDQKAEGLSRKKWHDVELDVKGKAAEVRINGQKVLSSTAHTPLAGAPALEALDGGVAFKNIRLHLHDSDPDYRAVALGEGYATDPAARPTVPTPGTLDVGTPAVAALALGPHVLFNKRDLATWRKTGSWAVRGGAMTARAAKGQVALAYAPGTATARDYVLRVQCRIVRSSDRVREGEYLLLVFRLRGPDSFYCVRVPIEGIYEVGYYHNGRFREGPRGVRKGHYNQWHEIQLSVRGAQFDITFDGIGRLPTYPVSTFFRRGAVGVGVTGGEAAFRDVRVRILR